MKKLNFVLLILLLAFSLTISAQSYIRTKDTVIVDARNQKQARIKMEVRPGATTTEGQNFLVIDWNYDNPEEAISSKDVFWTNTQINNMNAYLETVYNFSNLTRVESERKRLQYALLITVQTTILANGKTYYGLAPTDWELSD